MKIVKRMRVAETLQRSLLLKTHVWPQVTQVSLDRVEHLTGLPTKMATREFVAADK
jgi:hypothetical protein